MLFRTRKRRVERRRQPLRSPLVKAHYELHKEFARSTIHERVEYWNQHYSFAYNRIAIKNQRRCWGSCSAKQNLNFNYKLIFLPEALMDYVIVHELCHLAHLDHSPAFWARVAETLPEYREYRRHLRKMTHIPKHGFPSSIAAQRREIGGGEKVN